jgi:hypothetical protein
MYSMPDTAMPNTADPCAPGTMRPRWCAAGAASNGADATPPARSTRDSKHVRRHVRPGAALASLLPRNAPAVTDRWEQSADMPPVAPQLREHPGADQTRWGRARGASAPRCPRWFRHTSPGPTCFRDALVIIFSTVLCCFPLLFFIDARVTLAGFSLLMFLPCFAVGAVGRRYDLGVRDAAWHCFVAMLFLWFIAYALFGIHLEDALGGLLLCSLLLVPIAVLIAAMVVCYGIGWALAHLDSRNCWFGHALVAGLPAILLVVLKAGVWLASMRVGMHGI